MLLVTTSIQLKCDKWLNYYHKNGCNNYYDNIKKCFWNICIGVIKNLYKL